MRRTSSLMAACVAALVLITACSGSEPEAESEPGSEAPLASSDPGDGPSPEPEVDAMAGVYKLKTNVTRSNLPGKRDQVGSKSTVGVIVSCVDDACTDVHFRGVADVGSLSRAYRLQNDGGVLTGSGVRTGPCSQTSNPDMKGEFTETVTFKVTINGKTVIGIEDYVFVGCGFDVKATTAINGTRKAEVPYLNDSAVATLASAVTAYDAPVGKLYAEGEDCNGGSYAERAQCFKALLTPWLATFDGLQNGLDGALPSAPRGCVDQFDEFAIGKLRRQVEETIDALGSKQTLIRGVDKLMPTLGKTLSTEHEDLVTALTTCIDPSDVDQLGKNGTLAVDVVQNRLLVLPEA